MKNFNLNIVFETFHILQSLFPDQPPHYPEDPNYTLANSVYCLLVLFFHHPSPPPTPKSAYQHMFISPQIITFLT